MFFDRQDSQTVGQLTSALFAFKSKQDIVNFGATLEDNLRYQLMEQLKDLELKKRLLETKNTALEQATEKARACERYGERQVKTANCELCQAARAREKKCICHNCGREGHIKRDRMCPSCTKCHVFWTLRCLLCQRERKKKGDTSKNKSFRGQQKQYGRQKQDSTNQVDENGYSSESSKDGLAFSVTEGVHAVSDELMVPVGINGIVKDILIDSGSVSNLISLNEYEQLKSQGLNAHLSKSDKELFSTGVNSSQ